MADFGNDRVQVFGPTASLLGALGGRGSGDGQFLRPAGVAVDRDGTLYVTDHFNDRVERFSGDGRFQAQLGTIQAQRYARQVDSDRPGASRRSRPRRRPRWCATPRPDGDRLVRRSWHPPCRTPSCGGPKASSLDRDGNLWVADYGRDRVVKLGPDGRLLLSWGDRGSGPGEFVGPKGVAIDPSSGHLYVADTGNARIQRLAPDGTRRAVVADAHGARAACHSARSVIVL